MRFGLRRFTREPLYHYPMDRFLLRSPILYRADQFVVHIGGGPQRNHPLERNLNLFRGPNIDLVGDAERLPLADESVDVIISNAVLEHVRDLAAVTSEMNRVLKPGGHIYVEVPFVQSYHTHDGRGVRFEDYRRLTRPGLAQALDFCRMIDSGVCVGPISTFLQVTHALARDLWLAPWRRRCVDWAYRVIGNLLAPIDGWLPDDVIARSTIPSGVYFFGRKHDGASAWLDGLAWPNSLYPHPRDLRAEMSLERADPDRLRVRVKNTSRGAWLHSSRLSWGCVQLGLQWTRSGVTDRDFRRLPLPHDIAPGEHFSFDLLCAELPREGQLAIDPVIEGLCWFADRGGQPLRLPERRPVAFREKPLKPSLVSNCAHFRPHPDPI